MSNWTAKDALAHHGILGMKWGKRNGPPYPLGASQHSAAEKNAEKKKSFSLSDNQKKYIKIGATVVGTALVAYGAYKLSSSSYIRSMVANGMSSLSKRPSVDDMIANSGPEIVKKMPKDLGGVANPKGLKNNCKDVSEATLKRWLGVDSGAVAGEKSVTGNLHDFVEQRGYNKVGVQWLGTDGTITPDPSGDSSGRVTRQILKHFEDGDCGIISVDWDSKYVPPGMKETGHAFNWFIDKGKVKFIDDQPNPPITDAISHLKKVDPNIQMEICKITKEAFAH